MKAPASVAKHDDLIFDVGMHKGEDTHYYLQKGFRVVGFEANPDLVKHCKTVFADALRKGRLEIVEGAIVDPSVARRGEQFVRFYRNLNLSVWGTINEDWARRNEMLGTSNEAIDVPIVDFGGCLRQHGIPHYLKIDIEGADLICLKALFDFDLRPDFVSMESDIVSFQKVLEEIDTFKKLGYDQFKPVQQATIARQVAPNPSKEGLTLAHTFQPGSAGLFGRDLPHKWITGAEIIQHYKRMFVLYRIFGNYSIIRQSRVGHFLLRVIHKLSGRSFPGWYDTHAMHSSARDRRETR